jgi:hypothetical protein
MALKLRRGTNAERLTITPQKDFMLATALQQAAMS